MSYYGYKISYSAHCLYVVGVYFGSLACCQTALELYSSLFGENYFFSLNCMKAIAALQEDPNEALRIIKEVYNKGKEKKISGHHLEVIINSAIEILSRVPHKYTKEGRLESIRFNRELLVIQSEIYVNNIRLANTLTKIGKDLLFLGQNQEAEAIFREALARQLKDLPEDHNSVKATYFNIQLAQGSYPYATPSSILGIPPEVFLREPSQDAQVTQYMKTMKASCLEDELRRCYIKCFPHELPPDMLIKEEKWQDALMRLLLNYSYDPAAEDDPTNYPDISRTCGQIALCFHKLGDHKFAFLWILTAITRLKQGPESTNHFSMLFSLLLDISWGLLATRQFSDLQLGLQKLNTLSQQNSINDRMDEFHELKGYENLKRKFHDGAVHHFNESLRKDSKLSHFASSRRHHALGVALMEKKETMNAIGHFLIARKTLLQDDTGLRAQNLMSLAQAFTSLGNPENAIKYYVEALDQYRRREASGQLSFDLKNSLTDKTEFDNYLDCLTILGDPEHLKEREEMKKKHTISLESRQLDSLFANYLANQKKPQNEEKLESS